MPRRPTPLVVGPLRAAAIRGPRADGRWYWRARRYVDGTESCAWTGWASRAEVERELAALVVDGLDRHRSAYADLVTVADLLEAWVAAQEDRADLRPGTVLNYRTKARHLVGGVGPARLDRLDLVTLCGYRDRRLRGEAAPESVSMELNVLRIAWRWGREVGACPARDLPRVDVRKRATRNHSTPEASHVAAVVAHLTGWARAAVLLLYSTGARVGEIADLEWPAVDMDGALVRLDGKTGERLVPLAPEAVAVLSELPRDGARVFACAGRTVRVNLGGMMQRACERAGVPVFTPHGLRRLAVDRFLRAGVDVGTACAILGHSPAVMLQHYRRATLDDARRAVAAARMGALPTGDVLSFSRRG